MATKPKPLSPDEYCALAEFRRVLREFLAFSEQAAAGAGLEASQYQLLLAIRGRRRGERPTIGTLAEAMGLRPHTVVGLVDRMESNGLLERLRGSEDRRQVMVQTTVRGARMFERLAREHREELRETAPRLIRALRRVLARAETPAIRQGKRTGNPDASKRRGER